MDPNVWGKHMWASIHFIALAYPDAPTEENKNTYYSFFTNLYKVLPCHKCREHLKETLTNEYPLHANFLKNKDELFKWTFNLHNIVNKRLNKKIITFDEAFSTLMKKDKFYEAMCPPPILQTNENIQENILISNPFVIFVFVLALLCILTNIYYIGFIRKFKF
jgi:hypothetical protein